MIAWACFGLCKGAPWNNFLRMKIRISNVTTFFVISHRQNTLSTFWNRTRSIIDTITRTYCWELWGKCCCDTQLEETGDEGTWHWTTVVFAIDSILSLEFGPTLASGGAAVAALVSAIETWWTIALLTTCLGGRSGGFFFSEQDGFTWAVQHWILRLNSRDRLVRRLIRLRENKMDTCFFGHFVLLVIVVWRLLWKGSSSSCFIIVIGRVQRNNYPFDSTGCTCL